MSIKLLFGIVASIFSIACFAPYFRDVFLKKTNPHSYSWLVWSILQSVGVLAILSDRGGYGVLGLGIGAFLCTCMFLLSLKYGTKNITKFDTICLVGSLIAIGIWLFEKNALHSVILISIIDFVGFLPTYRKGYEEPFTETISTYFMSALAVVFDIFALSHYSITTTLYLGTLLFSNGFFVLLLVTRRKLLL
ncbi:MAG: hypothetical protein PHS53_02570 [Candidatus Pacebacteria bacterium]|nr:hypothetical protein [Candidatus Paceibacterota bacterium]MDD5357007.1 hypothetical protein [Candidatus Paceibacterota bacterium]